MGGLAGEQAGRQPRWVIPGCRGGVAGRLPLHLLTCCPTPWLSSSPSTIRSGPYASNPQIPPPTHPCLPCRYFHTLPFLLLRSPLPRWLALATLAAIEVRPQRLFPACLPDRSAADHGTIFPPPCPFVAPSHPLLPAMPLHPLPRAAAVAPQLVYNVYPPTPWASLLLLALHLLAMGATLKARVWGGGAAASSGKGGRVKHT